MATEAVWPGSGSAVSGTTPFGLYDTDSDFQTEAPQFATWCARRLGYPITAVELQDSQFYACLEESVSEYSAQVNQFNIRDNLLHLRGQSTSSNFTHKRVKPTLSETIFISEEYGQEVYWPPTPATCRERIQRLMPLRGSASSSGRDPSPVSRDPRRRPP